jgi:hypothetical protein
MQVRRLVDHGVPLHGAPLSALPALREEQVTPWRAPPPSCVPQRRGADGAREQKVAALGRPQGLGQARRPLRWSR